MIYFITNKIHNIINNPDNEDIEILNSNQLSYLYEYLDNKLHSDNLDIGFDLETTGLDAYKNDILLVILGDKKTKFVIDYQSIDSLTWSIIFKDIKDILRFLGQNIKFDWKFWKAKTGIELKSCYDTMLVEQRLYAGYEISNSLDSINQRYFGVIPKEMNKSIRLDFIGANPNTFIFQTKHILYAAGDVGSLEDIRDKQLVLIKKWNLEFLINEIEMPLINVLAECELEGFVLDTVKWKEIIEENKITKFQKECELDNEIKRLRDGLTNEQRLYLIGGKFDRERIKYNKPINIGLFGEPTKEVKVKDNPNNFNYSSPAQIVDLFARLHQPLPTKEDEYEIPVLLKNGKIDDKGDNIRFTTGEGAIESYLIYNPDSIMKTFIKTLIDFREVNTQLNTFGQSFLDYINPITNKIHSIFRQCNAVNGRLQSGNTDESYINIQNIPAKKKFRECFGTDKGYSIVTIDLEGAEVVVMADKANDLKLFELAMKGDIHSHMAQKGWRNIYKKRYDIIKDTMDFEEEDKLKELSENFIVSKIINNESHRKPCKNLTFGVVYGCHNKKASRTINVSKEEGQVYINTIKSEIPLTFKMVENNVKLALKQGYIVFNTRTNSRLWFPKAINAIKNRIEIDFMDKIEVDGQARNTPISGTQADMVKESMVVIYKYIKENKIDSVLLAQVHDELVYKIPDSILDWFPNKIKELLLETSNKYLTNIKIEASMEVHKYWTK